MAEREDLGENIWWSGGLGSGDACGDLLRSLDAGWNGLGFRGESAADCFRFSIEWPGSSWAMDFGFPDIFHRGS
jgi:hypothetical protein